MNQEHGKLVVLEGLDGVGKSTQLEAVAMRMRDITGGIVRTLHYPTDHLPTGDIIRSYLFGTFMAGASAHAVASLFALDRYAYYSSAWAKDYLAGDLILCDRYTTANFVYQAARVEKSQREEFVKWCKEYEYGVLGLPEPDLVIWLDLPVEESDKFIAQRHKRGVNRDKYENDPYFRYVCREVAHTVVEREKWTVVHCIDEGGVRTPKLITEDIVTAILRHEARSGDP